MVILGATGGCVDILNVIQDINDSCSKEQIECIGFLDDNETLINKEVLGVPVLGGFKQARELKNCYFVTGIGSSKNFWRRSKIIEDLQLPIERYITLIHPRASISRFANIGKGSVIYPNVVISTKVNIDNYVLVLPNSVISHGSHLGSYTIVNAVVSISGDVSIGESCYIGTHSSVRQNIQIGSNSLIGMGSVVIKDVPELSIYAGSPARFLRNIDINEADKSSVATE